MIQLKVQKKELFNKWLEWLSPIIKITESERKVLSSLISLHYTYRHYHNLLTLNELLFSEGTLKDLAQRLKIKELRFNKIIKTLREKDLIKEDQGEIKYSYLNPSLTNYPKDNKFKIQVEISLFEST